MAALSSLSVIFQEIVSIMSKIKNVKEKALTLASETESRTSQTIKSTAEKTAEVISIASSTSAKGAAAAFEFAGAKLSDIKSYVESEEFEHDLDDLGVRLGVTPENLQVASDKHWERTLHKLNLIGQQAALDTYLRDKSTLKMALAAVALGRFVPQVNMVLTAANLGLIVYHCYQVYSNRKAKSAAA